MSVKDTFSYNTVMEDHFAEFMKILAQAAKVYKPLAADTLRIFEETRKAATEKKPSGGATDKARQAIQRLRNAFLSSTHHNKAKAVAAVLVKETGKDFAKLFGEVISAYAVHQQSRLEYSLLEGAQPDFRSREDGPLDESADVIRFVEVLRAHGVAPHMLGRLYDWMYPLIARLILDGNQDRYLERPDNLWPVLKNVGILDAYAGELSKDEERLLAGVAAVREDPETLARWEQFEQRFPEMDVTPGFKAACQRLINVANELSDGEARAMFDALGGRRLAQTETLGKLLGLSLDEQIKVDAFVRVIEDPTWAVAGGEDDRNRRLIINSLVLHFEDCEREGEHPSEWIPLLVPKLLREDGFIARHVPSEAAFWSLTFAALELSSFRQREETKFLRQRQTADQATRDALQDFYERQGMAHHIDRDGIPWVGDALPEPDEIDPPQDHEADRQSAPGSHRPWDRDETDHIPEAEFTDVCDDRLPAKAQYRAPHPAERNRGERSPSSHSRFEEYE